MSAEYLSDKVYLIIESNALERVSGKEVRLKHLVSTIFSTFLVLVCLLDRIELQTDASLILGSNVKFKLISESDFYHMEIVIILFMYSER